MTFETILIKLLKERAIEHEVNSTPDEKCVSCAISINIKEHIENDMELIVEKLVKTILDD